jgi:hypothetical protein
VRSNQDLNSRRESQGKETERKRRESKADNRNRIIMEWKEEQEGEKRKKERTDRATD